MLTSKFDKIARFCAKPSGVPRGPSHLQFPWLLRATMRSPLRSPAQVEGTQGFLPQPGRIIAQPNTTGKPRTLWVELYSGYKYHVIKVEQL